MIACITSASSRGAANMAIEPMSVHRSSEYETSSDSSIQSLPKSRIIPHSVTAGDDPRTQRRSWQSAARRLGASLTLKLMGLVGIFFALPIVLYGPFQSAPPPIAALVPRPLQPPPNPIRSAPPPHLP